jgi:hypothetical protein
MWLWVAFSRLSRFEVRGSGFDVGCWMFGVQHKHLKYISPPAPPSGWSGGTLDKPWTCPGTIEPPESPVFDQPHLFSSRHPPLRRLNPAHAVGSGEHARRGRALPIQQRYGCVLPAPTAFCRRLPRRDHGVYPMRIIESPLFAGERKSGFASRLFSARLARPIPADRAAVPR